MQPHELRRAEDVRATNDIRVADVRDWVGEQLGHPDPRIAAAAQQVLDGDLAVWELVDLVLGDDDLRSGAAATLVTGARLYPHRPELAERSFWACAACQAWVDAGCPERDRHPLTEAALGALEGALGDWGG